MREMKDSGVAWIGEIPKEWTLERLQWHLTEIKESNNPIKTKQILSLTNKLGVIPYEEKGAQGNVAKENYDEYKIAYPNTIVVNSMNVLIGSVGICNYFGCVSPVYYVLMPNKMDNLEFLNYIFQTEQFQKELRRYANGILEIRLRVSSAGILKRMVAFPSCEMQQRIVNTLNQKCSKVDALIANQQAQIEKLKAYKQSLITEVVTHGLNPDAPMKDSGVEWIGQVPEGWKVNKIVRCFSMIGSGTTPKLSDDKLFNGDINWIQSGDINGADLTETRFHISNETVEALSALRVYKAPFIVIAMYGASIGNLSISKVDACTNQACCCLSNPADGVELKYIFYVLKPAKDYLIWKADGGGQPNISQDKIKSLWISLPSLPEQQQIVAYLDTKCAKIDALITLKQTKIDKLTEYKKSLIYEYVTGKKEA